MLRTFNFGAVLLSALAGFLLIVFEYLVVFFLQMLFRGYGDGLKEIIFGINLIVILGVPVLIGYLAARIAQKYSTLHAVIAALITSCAAIIFFNIQYSVASILIYVAYLIPPSLHFAVPDSVLGGYVNGTSFVLVIFIIGAIVGPRIYRSKGEVTDYVSRS